MNTLANNFLGLLLTLATQAALAEADAKHYSPYSDQTHPNRVYWLRMVIGPSGQQPAPGSRNARRWSGGQTGAAFPGI